MSRVILIGQAYSSNSGNTADLRTIPPVIAKVARDHANIEGIINFSGSGRATGWQDHPEVQPDWQKVFDGITGTPIIVPPQPQPIPPDPPHPQPPDPVPIPPQPIPPQEPLMILYGNQVIKENQPLPASQTMLPGTLKSHPEGGGVAIWRPDGYVVTVTPGGDIQKRPESGPPDPNYRPGSWEKFQHAGGFLMAEREGHVYALICAG